MAHPSITSVELFGPPSDALKILSPDDQQMTQPFPHLRRLTLGKMAYLDLELEDIRIFRRFFTTHSKLVNAGTHKRLQLLRLDRSILDGLKTADVSLESVTYVDDFEDDDDYDSDLDDDLMTDGASDFDDGGDEPLPAQQEPPTDAALPNEDLDELEDDPEAEDDDDNGSFEDTSVSVGHSDDEDDEEVEVEGVDADDANDTTLEIDVDEVDEAKVASGLAAANDEEDELASNSSDHEDGEHWLRKHVDLLETIDYDWKLENP